MSDHDEKEAAERDSDSGEDRDSDSEIESEREPAKAEPKKVAAKPRAGVGAKRGAAAAPASASSSVPSSRVGLFVVLALAAGGAAGWFGHIQQANAALKAADSTPTTVSSSGEVSGPCGAWQEKICSSSGKQSSACQQAKGATDLLMPSTCQAGLASMPATLTKLKAARAGCEKLVAKLCADLPPGSQTCAMVKERTPSFPPQRCDEMMKHYDEVIGQLKQIEEQGGMQMGGPGGPGGPGPVMPPH